MTAIHRFFRGLLYRLRLLFTSSSPAYHTEAISSLPNDQLTRVAVHELGHLITGAIVEHRLYSITTIPEEMLNADGHRTLGQVQADNQDHDYLISKYLRYGSNRKVSREMITRLNVLETVLRCMAGQAMEERVYHNAPSKVGPDSDRTDRQNAHFALQYYGGTPLKKWEMAQIMNDAATTIGKLFDELSPVVITGMVSELKEQRRITGEENLLAFVDRHISAKQRDDYHNTLFNEFLESHLEYLD